MVVAVLAAATTGAVPVFAISAKRRRDLATMEILKRQTPERFIFFFRRLE